MSSNVKNRIQELNNRLADTLVEKGIDANGQETTTELIKKVGQFQPGEIPNGYIKPEGSIDITENGTFDIREKAEVNVQVVAKPEKPYIDSSKLKYFAYMFSKKDGTADLSLLENIDTSNGTNFSSMFYDCNTLTKIPQLDTSNGTNFESMFRNCSNLTKIPQLDTSMGTKFVSMFYGCSNLTEIPQLDISNGTSFGSLFSGCSNLTKIPQLDTSNGIIFESMFRNCSNLTEIPQLDTSKGRNFLSMFYGCSNLTKIPYLGTSKGTNFGSMFYGCSNLTKIPQLDTSKGTEVSNMFSGCISLVNIKFVGINIFDNNFSVKDSPLSEESLASLINALSDNSGLNKTYTVTLGSNNLAKLTDEQLAIARNKNILLQ